MYTEPPSHTSFADPLLSVSHVSTSSARWNLMKFSHYIDSAIISHIKLLERILPQKWWDLTLSFAFSKIQVEPLWYLFLYEITQRQSCKA